MNITYYKDIAMPFYSRGHAIVNNHWPVGDSNSRPPSSNTGQRQAAYGPGGQAWGTLGTLYAWSFFSDILLGPILCQVCDSYAYIHKILN